MQKLFSHLKHNLHRMDFIVCILLSIILPIATKYISNNSADFSPLLILQITSTFLGLILSVVIFRCLMNYLANHHKWKRPSKHRRIKLIIDRFFNSKHLLLWLTIIIFICWLPTIFMLYPGTMINDSWGQLNQVLNLEHGEWSLSSHHPVFDTFLMGVIIVPVHSITHNWHFGFFAYVIIQAVCTSLCFAYSIKYMRDKFTQGNLTSLIFLLIYCFFPVFAASVQTISKDALSAWIYLLFIIGFIEIIRTKGSALISKRFLLFFILICLLCVLSKKVETYVILGSLLCLAIFQKPQRKKLFIPILSTLIFSFLFIPLIQHTFHIESSGVQEMLSLPFQQTARYVKEHPGDVSEQDKDVISKVLDYDNLPTDYDPTNADNVKGYTQRGKTKDYLAYLQTWVSQGLKHPDTYLAATGAQLAGWFSFSLYQPLTNMTPHTQFNSSLMPDDSPYNRNAFFSSTADFYNKAYRFIGNIPILGVTLTFAFFATIIPWFILCSFIKTRKLTQPKYFLICVPLFLSIIIGCYLAPVSAHPEGIRYLYPIVYTAPVTLMLLTSTYRKSRR